MLLLQPLYRSGTPGTAMLFLEGVLVAVLGTLFAWWLFPAEASLVCVFLAALASGDSIQRLLSRNQREILHDGVKPAVANRRLTVAVAAMFAGCFVGFSALAIALPLPSVESIFARQLAEVGGTGFPELDFGSLWALLSHNLWVVVFFFVIGVPFRQGGVMLAVGWNASVWGATFAVLARQWTAAGGPLLPDAYGRVVGACIAHMSLEAYGYTVAGLAGVLLGRDLVKYGWGRDRAHSLVASVPRMLLVATVFVLLGAIWETSIGPLLAGWAAVL